MWCVCPEPKMVQKHEIQGVGNFVGDVNLLDPLSTSHLIKALLPAASRRLATACQERK